MQQPQRQINIEAEKKRNVSIAIGLGASGVILGFILYFGFFVLMFAFPVAFGSFASLSTENKDLVSVNDKLLLFTERAGFQNSSSERSSHMKTYMSEFDGKTFTNKVEVQPFSTISAYDGKLYFFSSGKYAVYDFNDWQVVENAAIGDAPKGVASPNGIWILSDLMDRPALVLLKDGLALDVPLPLTEEDEGRLVLCTSKLLWSDGQLHLFWKISGSLLHEVYDGQSWHAAGYFENPGDYDVVDLGGKLTLFTYIRGNSVMMYSYEGGQWSQPKKLDIRRKGIVRNFSVATYQGKTAVLVQHAFPGSVLYLIEDGKVVSHYDIERPFMGTMRFWAVLVNILMYAVPILIIFIISTVVNKVKLTYWQLKRGRVRFASIFRRFLAYFIDSIVTLVPLIFVIVAVVLYFKDKLDNLAPEKFIVLFGIVILSVLTMIIIKYLYFSLMEGLWGRTVGKWVCGIMVLRDNFTRCTLGPAFLRNLLRIVDGMFYYFVGVVSIGATLKWQRLGDLAAETVVVRARRRKKTPKTQTPRAEGQERP